MDDKVIWCSNKNGKLSVKSAYFLDQESRFADSGVLKKKEWKHLWKLKLQERLKLLLWKIANNSLPAKAILCSRLNICEDLCPRCNSEQETIEHVFFKCPFAIIVWRNSVWPINFIGMPSQPIEDWVRTILNPYKAFGIKKEEGYKFTLFVAICYDQLWCSRNKLVHDGEDIQPVTLAQQINKVYFSHLKAWEEKLTPHVTWQPPTQGWWKINAGAAVRDNRIFLASVCRDSDGNLIRVWTRSHVKGSDNWAEAQAVLMAVREASRLNLSYIFLEGDSQNIINALN